MPLSRNPDAIKRQLRTLFERRDRMAADVDELDAQINQQIRALADAEGIAFMRIEAARRIAFQRETEAA